LERLEQKSRRSEMIRVTIDYSCLSKKGETKDMTKLKNFARRRLIGMKGTEHMDKEYYESSPANVRAKLKKQFESFQKLYPEDPAVLGEARLGRFRLGGEGTVRDGKGTFDFFNEFKALMYPDFDSLSEENKKRTENDIMHLSIHYVFERDVFLTKDEKLVVRSEALGQRFPDLVIMKPEQLVSFLVKLFRKRNAYARESV